MSYRRTENSIRNVSVAIAVHVLTLLLSFTVRTVFVHKLGSSYLGINGLFTNVLSLLSFAELGFGTAIVYALYKPLADDNRPQVCALMNYYAHVYRLVGTFILIAGFILTPMLPQIIGDVSQLPKDLPPIYVIYWMYITDTGLGYFFNYKRSLVVASQNSRVDSLNVLIFTAIRDLIQIIILVNLQSFTLYLFIKILCTFGSNVSISIKADTMFPYLKEYRKRKLDKCTKSEINKNVVAMMCHKLGSVVVSGTDNIMITMFVGLAATGIYSNYVLLVNTAMTLFLQCMTPITASVGNLIASADKEKSYSIFKRIMFVNAVIAIIATCGLITVSNSFVQVMWGNEYLLETVLVIMIMVNFFINCMRKTSQIFIDTTGLFWQIRWKSVIEAVINLAASIYFAQNRHMGIGGIVLGTIVSNIATNFWWEPYVIYHYYLHKSLIDYMLVYLQYTAVLLLSVLMVMTVSFTIPFDLLGVILRIIISLVVSIFILWLFFKNTEQYAFFIGIVHGIIKKFKKK